MSEDMSEEKTSSSSLGEVLEEVRWDYDPTRRLASPLLPTARYFEDFPWEGGSEPPPQAAAEDRG